MMEHHREYNKRRYRRFFCSNSVEVLGDFSVSATSVNVSSGGMQIAVKKPVSHDSIKRISFQIPGTCQSRTIALQTCPANSEKCRGVRTTRGCAVSL